MKKLWIVAFAIALVACGGPGTSAGEEGTTGAAAAEGAGSGAGSSTAESAARETAAGGFAVTVTGAVETELSGPGYYQCIDGADYGLADRIVVASQEDLTGDRVLLFELPTDAEAGTHELVGQGDPDSELGVDTRVSLQIDADSLGVGNFDDRVEGQLVLEALPAEPGDPVRGTFEFSAVDSDERQARVEGGFDFASPESRIAFCDEAGSS